MTTIYYYNKSCSQDTALPNTKPDLSSKDTILIRATLHRGQQPTTIRRFVMSRDRPNFLELQITLNKLFYTIVAPRSFYYMDAGLEKVSFSSDDELAIAFFLTDKGSELRIYMEVKESFLDPAPKEAPALSRQLVLKEENPSSDSSAIISSLESSPSSQDSTGSTPTGNNPSQKYTSNMAAGGSGNSTPSLYRSKIVPKLKSQYSLDTSSNNSVNIDKELNEIRRIAKPLYTYSSDGCNRNSFINRHIDGNQIAHIFSLSSNESTENALNENESQTSLPCVITYCCRQNECKCQRAVRNLKRVMKHACLFLLLAVRRELF